MNLRLHAGGRRRGRGSAATSPLLALVAVLALSGCSASGQEIDFAPRHPDNTAGQASGHPAGTEQDPAALPHSKPTWIDVPRIDAHSSLIPLGLNPDRTVAVPSVHQPMQAGWYRYGPTPGETGPAVILGHVNGDGQDGIFARLHELEPGAEIRVGRQDGKVARFVVRNVEQMSKKQFRTDEVYGDTAGPELRLITCGGSFDYAAGSYRDNIVAFAEFVGVATTTGEP